MRKKKKTKQKKTKQNVEALSILGSAVVASSLSHSHFLAFAFGVLVVELTMRVLVVCAEFVDPIFSGNGVLCRSLCQGLFSSGHEVSVHQQQATSKQRKGRGKTKPKSSHAGVRRCF